MFKSFTPSAQSTRQRMKLLAPLTALMSLSLALLSSGCATSAQTRSGFISSYGGLAPVKNAPGLYAEKDGAYDSHRPIQVAPVRWQADGNDPTAFDDDQRTGLCAFAQDEFERALAKSQSTTPQAANRHPLELRSTITRVEMSNPALNVVTTLAVFMPLNNGGVCLEWKLVDPASEETLAQGVAVQTGKPWQVMASFRTLGHAKDGLIKISTELASYLDAGAERVAKSH
jgi:hypothetical protein